MTTVEEIEQAAERLAPSDFDRLAAHVKAALGLSLAQHEFALEVRQPSAPPVDVAYAFDVALSTIGWLVPLGVFRRPFGLVLVRKAWWEGEEKTVAPGCGLLP